MNKNSPELPSEDMFNAMNVADYNLGLKVYEHIHKYTNRLLRKAITKRTLGLLRSKKKKVECYYAHMLYIGTRRKAIVNIGLAGTGAKTGDGRSWPVLIRKPWRTKAERASIVIAIPVIACID